MSAPGWPSWSSAMFHEVAATMTSETASPDQTGRGRPGAPRANSKVQRVTRKIPACTASITITIARIRASRGAATRPCLASAATNARRRQPRRHLFVTGPPPALARGGRRCYPCGMATATPPARPAPGRGRSLDYFLPLSPAEEKLLDGYRRGKMAEIGTGRPTEATPENRVSAAFIRFLALGGDEAAQGHEHGVELRGAWVEGTLAFESAELAHRLVLKDCRLEAILPVQARLKFLALDGSSLAKGMLALSCRCESDIRLADGFHSEDGIYLSKAQIGSLDCNGGRFGGGRRTGVACEGA